MTPLPIREEQQGKLTLLLVRANNGFAGAIRGGPGGQPVVLHGTDPDEVWRRLELEAGKLHPSYFGFGGARARFLREFPEGFSAHGYLETERNYKLGAKARLDAAVPLFAAAAGSGFGPAVLRVYKDKDSNLLNWHETDRLKELLTGASADVFVRAVAAFTLGAGAPALAEMERLLRSYDSAKWTVVTYLPFLWRPDRHMFLKPTITKDFAARVGHRFAHLYESGLVMTVYESLLDLAACTETELADLHPQDRIDVQSFIWVIGQPEPPLIRAAP